MPHHSTATAKKVTAKPHAKDSKNAPSGPGKSEAHNEDINHMISTAAYYRAEHRNFNGGDVMEDWLEAEAEINSKLHH